MMKLQRIIIIMSKQIYKINTEVIKNLASITGMGIIALSILMTGCTDQNAKTTGKAVSPEAIAKRIEPIGEVNIAHSPDKTNEIAANPANSK
jgi:hypothetical protein